MTKISPSLLAADFTRLGDESRLVLAAGADMLHFDVMDGAFVPNISIGIPVLQALKNKIDTVYDVHLMIEKPESYIEKFRGAGADIITVHLEACADARAVLEQIKKSGAKAGISIKPETSAESVFPYLDIADMVLIMSVEPGFGGQAFMPSAVDKIKAVKAEIIRRGLNTEIEVDGGINAQTAQQCVSAGADILVAGSSVFLSDNPKAAIELLKKA